MKIPGARVCQQRIGIDGIQVLGPGQQPVASLYEVVFEDIAGSGFHGEAQSSVPGHGDVVVDRMIVLVDDDFTRVRPPVAVLPAGVVADGAVVGPVRDEAPAFVVPYDVVFYEGTAAVILAYIHDDAVPLRLRGIRIRIVPDAIPAHDIVLPALVQIDGTGPATHRVIVDTAVLDGYPCRIVQFDRTQRTVVDVHVADDHVGGGAYPDAKPVRPEIADLETLDSDEPGQFPEIPVLEYADAVRHSAASRHHDLFPGKGTVRDPCVAGSAVHHLEYELVIAAGTRMQPGVGPPSYRHHVSGNGLVSGRPQVAPGGGLTVLVAGVGIRTSAAQRKRVHPEFPGLDAGGHEKCQCCQEQ